MATKDELRKLAADLYKRLGGAGNRDARIVRALLLNWNAAELSLEVAKLELTQKAEQPPAPEGGGR